MTSNNNLGFGSSNQKKINVNKYDLKYIKNKADNFFRKGVYYQAQILYEKITNSGYDSAESYINLSRIYRKSYRVKDSIKILERSLKFVSGSTSHLTELALLYRENNQLERCFDCLKRGNAIDPENIFILELLASSSFAINKFDTATNCFLKLIEFKPEEKSYLEDISMIFEKQNDISKALKYLKKILIINRNDTNTLLKIAYLYLKIGDFTEAKNYFQNSIDIDPLSPDNNYGLGLALSFTGKYQDAIQMFKRAISQNPKFERAISELMRCQSFICDWDGLKNNMKELETIGLKNESVSPYIFLAIEDDPLRHLQRSLKYSNDFCNEKENKINCFDNKKIRIGYFSSDFYDHATMHLMKRIFEYHDTSKFEIFIYSYGFIQDDVTNWLKGKVFSFYDISQLSDFAAAELARNHNLDISVDLKGHTLNSRIFIFSYRTAPIQITYLGYPGTTGLKTMDYILADKELIDDGEEKFYQEKIIRMPFSYQCNDNRKEILDKKFKKSDLGLPDEGFVFTCFNSNEKITEEVFDIWMKLLLNVENSVLWLIKSSGYSEANLKLQANKKGINPSRLIFAEKIPLNQHLARHKCGDLFLDTFNYNAHTTASDALWSGMPMISLKGKSFASRVGASLLNGLNMQELICLDKNDYYESALRIAKDPKLLENLREKLKKQILISPLFDSERFTRDLEKIYINLARSE